jgi:hypothetical protein
VSKLPIPAAVLGPAAPSLVPSETDNAYAAGFFDGEGNITIAANWRAGERRASTAYHMRVGAGQNDPLPLVWLRARWGGTTALMWLVRAIARPEGF